MNSLAISLGTSLEQQIQATNSEKYKKLTANFLNSEELENEVLRIKRIKESSIRVYKSSLGVFKSFMRKRNVTLITENDIISFEEFLKTQKLSVFTVIAYLSSIKSFFSVLSNRGLYPDITKGIKTPKKPRGFQRDSLTKTQAQQLLTSAQGDDIISKRDLAVLNILLRCGLRSIEIERADVGDIRYQKGVPVLFVQGKGRDSKDDFVVLTQQALSSIQNYLILRENPKQTDPLFGSHGNRGDLENSGHFQTRSIRRMVKKHLKLIGLNNARLTCHSLRHTFATLAFENKAPLVSVQKAMRHSNINSTLIYTHLLDRLTNGAESYIDLDSEIES